MNVRVVSEARLAALCAAAGIAAGIVWLILRGASPVMPAINLLAAAIGVTAVIPLARAMQARVQTLDVIAVLSCVAIAAPLLFGPRVEGIARWVELGPVRLEPAMIVLPLALILHARDPRQTSTVALALTALALAFQPDRSMATVLAATVFVLALLQGGLAAWGLVAWSIATAAMAFARPDPLAPVPFVENVLNDAFAHGLASGLVMTLAAGLVVLPAAIARSTMPAARIAFATCWGFLLAASVVGPFPTPVLGFGASGVLGYVLSLAALTASHYSAASRLRR